MFDVGYWDVG